MSIGSPEKQKITCQMLIDGRKKLWEKSGNDIAEDQLRVDAICTQLMLPENHFLLIELKEHPEYLIEMVFIIVDKDENTVPFFLNAVQRKFIKKYYEAKKDFDKGKITSLYFLVLKGRQMGFTSFITAFQLAHSILWKNFTGMTIADNADNAHTIFEDKAKYPYDHLPAIFKPTEKYNNRQELHFSKLNSRWRISTAGNKEVGRSKTLRFFHFSEAAFCDSISKVMLGLGQSLTKNSTKILESTANGFNEFQILWKEAIAGENKCIPLFYEWWQTPEYFINFVSEFQKNEFIEKINTKTTGIWKTMRWLIDYAGLSYEQLHWYYDKYLELKDLLAQEYPNTPDEAFISTGTQIFDQEKLVKRKAELIKAYEIKPPRVGNISYEYDEDLQVIIKETIRFTECANGNVSIYEEPQNGYPYCNGGDIAEGGADFSGMCVINNMTGNEAAVLHGKYDTDIYAKDVYCLGYIYNWALIGIEVNFDQHPTKELQRLKYPNMYFRESMDSITKVKLEKYGFYTSSNTRPILLDKLVVLVRDNIELINHIPEIDEMLSFIRNDKGKACAMDGAHDDLVLSRGISEMIRTQGKLEISKEDAMREGHYHYRELEALGYKRSQIKRMFKSGRIHLIGKLPW